jgi:hypothetical protein
VEGVKEMTLKKVSLVLNIEDPEQQALYDFVTTLQTVVPNPTDLTSTHLLKPGLNL